MQIHEITYQALNEAGFGSGLATGLSGALGKVGIAAPDASAYGGDTGGSNDQLAAFKATAGLVNTMATTAAKTWAQTVAKYQAQSKDSVTDTPATSVDQLDPPTQQMMKQDLYNIVNGAIYPRGDFDFNKLGSNTNDKNALEQADIIKTAIIQNIDNIWANTLKNASGKVLLPLWKDLTQNGIAPAQNFLRFSQKGADVQFRQSPISGKLELLLPGKSSWQMFDPKNIEHLKVGREKGIIPLS